MHSSGCIVHYDALETHQADRVRSCGTPGHMWRMSGEHHDFARLCSSRWCEKCAAKRASRAYAKISEAFESTDQDHIYMLTLTRRARTNVTLRELKLNIYRDRMQWSEATCRMRWDDYRIKKYRETKDLRYRQQLREHGIKPVKVRMDDDSLPVASNFWDDRWHNVPEERTYLWCMEITPGKNDDLWHVHRHVACPDLVTAQRLACAACAHYDYIQGTTPYRIDITKFTTEHAAGYLAGYMTAQKAKKGGWLSAARSLDFYRQRMWVRALKDVRQYDAAGAWRPLGMSPEPSDDPPVIVADQWGVYDAASYFSSTPRSSRGGEFSEYGATPEFAASVKTNSEKVNEFNDLCTTLPRSKKPRSCLKQNACANLPDGACDHLSFLEPYRARGVPTSLLDAIRESGVRFSSSFAAPSGLFDTAAPINPRTSAMLESMRGRRRAERCVETPKHQAKKIARDLSIFITEMPALPAAWFSDILPSH